jgi:hypothetical protein
MKQISRIGVFALLVGLCVSPGRAQNPQETPQYQTLNLKVEFEPDPMVIKLEAGGGIKTSLGGFDHFVAKKPDVRLNYRDGKFPVGKYVLTIYADCDADATLLIRLPNGKWIGNDNGLNAGKNPVLKFTSPLAGTYDIWVGAIDGSKTWPARLFITEMKR